VDSQLAGLLAVSDDQDHDTDADGAKKIPGLRIDVATDDSLTTAHALVDSLGIGGAHGEVKPADKLVLKLQAVSWRWPALAWLPALARADVGITLMGTSTDII
jgi:Cu+-exporting ATPase